MCIETKKEDNNFLEPILSPLKTYSFVKLKVSPHYRENESQRTQASCDMVNDKITNRTQKSFNCPMFFHMQTNEKL